MTGGAQLIHRCMQVTVGAAEAYDEEVGIVLVALDFEVGHFNLGHLLGTQACHQVVVLGVCGDGASLAVLLQSA